MEGSNIATEGAAFGFMEFHLDVPERMGGTSKPTKIFRWEIFVDWIVYLHCQYQEVCQVVLM